MRRPHETERERSLRLQLKALSKENDELQRKLSKALGDLCSALDLASYRQLLLALHAPDVLKNKKTA